MKATVGLARRLVSLCCWGPEKAKADMDLRSVRGATDDDKEIYGNLLQSIRKV